MSPILQEISWLKTDEIKIRILPKTNEALLSKSFGCIKFFDSYWFLSSSLDSPVKTFANDDFEILGKEFPDKWEYLF